MSTLAYYPSFIEHDYLLRMEYRAHSLRHYDACAVSNVLSQCFSESHVCFHVKGRERVIKEHYRRFFDYCPCNGKPLLLTAGYIGAALRHFSVESLRSFIYELGRLSYLSSQSYFFIACVLIAPADILSNSAREKDALLRHVSDGISQRLKPDIPYIDAAYSDPSLSYIEKPRYQVYKSSFSAACRADDSGRLTRSCGEINISQNIFLCIRIPEGNMLKPDLCAFPVAALSFSCQADSVLLIFDGGFRVQDFIDPVRRYSRSWNEYGHAGDHKE